MGNYIFTRKEAAEELEISVRSIDRYIKSGKLRSKKKGKIVYVHTEDVANIGGSGSEKKHIIITKSSNKAHEGVASSKKVVKKSDYDKLTKTFENVYTDLRNQIEKKDELIQKMSVQIGQTQEQMKHSISVTEHNRSQMLLEESRGHITKQMTSLNQDKQELEKALKDEKFDKKVLILFVFVLLIIAAYFWFQNV